MSSGPSQECRKGTSSGTSRLSIISMSSRTSGSQFSLMARLAEVCSSWMCIRPTENCDSSGSWKRKRLSQNLASTGVKLDYWADIFYISVHTPPAQPPHPARPLLMNAMDIDKSIESIEICATNKDKIFPLRQIYTFDFRGWFCIMPMRPSKK